MAERSGFFPYVEGDSDSEYSSDWLAKYISSIISSGVYNGELGVTADGSAMAVTLPSGRAWINGYHYRNDGNLTLPIDNADGVLNRIDVIVLRWDINARSITAQVIKGTPASNALAPAITRTVEQYDLKLAEINIPAGTTAITQSLITDCRFDKSVCGIVTGVVDQVDTTTFYNQIADDLARFRTVNENEFTEWFNSIKNILDENAAGNLKAEIDALQTEVDEHIANVNNPHHVTRSKISAAAVSYYTATITTSWNGDDFPYTQDVSVPGILATDNPIVSPIYDSDKDTRIAQKGAWNMISKAETSNGVITFTCDEELPTTEIPIQIQVVR